jgi:biopolymer transport protein TolR
MASTQHRGRGRRALNEINMVPFIDVMLVLLIIFMVTAPLIAPSLIELPSVGKAGRTPDQVVEIIIARDESLQMKTPSGTVPVALKALAAQVLRLQQQHPGAGATAVVISADRNVKYETVVKVMDNLQRAGVARVGLSVQLSK